jgi:hypothetical protein
MCSDEDFNGLRQVMGFCEHCNEILELLMRRKICERMTHKKTFVHSSMRFLVEIGLRAMFVIKLHD